MGRVSRISRCHGVNLGRQELLGLDPLGQGGYMPAVASRGHGIIYQRHAVVDPVYASGITSGEGEAK